MLQAIRQAGGTSGAGLRKVEDRRSAEAGEGGNKLEETMKMALAKINDAAGLSSSEDETDDSDDDDWDDDEWETNA